MNIGENIKNRREAANLTQAQLAEMVCVHRTMITQLENNWKQPTLGLTIALADVFGCTVDDLLKSA